MKEIAVRKEEQDGTVVFTFRFKALRDLLDEEDPAPLPGRVLTEEAEDAIAGHLDEYRVGRAASVVVELPHGDLERSSPDLVADTIRHHFGFRQDDVTHELKISRREGTYSLIVAIGNVAVLIFLAYYVTESGIPFDTFLAGLTLGFLTILNWVTVWHTYEHFVYGYRNLNRKRRIFRKLTTIPITVRGY